MEKCSNISKSGSKCFRRAEENSDFCSYHNARIENAENTAQYLNDDCPICLETKGEMYPLPCFHRAHLECLSGMTKLECPFCRAKLSNLPLAVRTKIEKNGEDYKEQVHEEERQEILELLEREGRITERIPPHVELMLAMKYVFELGIPLQMIPPSVIIELDTDSPLPDPGSIFQNAVKKILHLIETHVLTKDVEEDDSSGDCDGDDCHDGCCDDDSDCYTTDELGDITSDDESLFDLEGDDLQITHQVQIVPAPGQGNRNHVSLRIPAMFTTITFNIRDFDENL